MRWVGLIVFLALGYLFYWQMGVHEEFYCSVDLEFCTIEHWDGEFPTLSGRAVVGLPPTDLETIVDVVLSGDTVLFLDGKEYWNPAWDEYWYQETIDGVDIYSAQEDMPYYGGLDVEDFLLSNNYSYYFFGFDVDNPLTVVNESSKIFEEAVFGNGSFYVYLNDGIKLDITKTDFNFEEGKDDYVVRLVSVENDTEYSTTIEDDDNGHVGMINDVQKAFFSVPAAGLYLLSFNGSEDSMLEFSLKAAAYDIEPYQFEIEDVPDFLLIDSGYISQNGVVSDSFELEGEAVFKGVYVRRDKFVKNMDFLYLFVLVAGFMSFLWWWEPWKFPKKHHKTVHKHEKHSIWNFINQTLAYSFGFLIISSIWLPYENFLIVASACMILLLITLYLPDIFRIISAILAANGLMWFLYFNFNYLHVSGISLLLGLVLLYFLNDIRMPYTKKHRARYNNNMLSHSPKQSRLHTDHEMHKVQSTLDKGRNTHKKTISMILKILTYGVPLLVVLYILYMNFLPFGYSKVFTVDVGSPDDTSSEFYLEHSPSLGARQEINGTTFRAVDGVVHAVFKPKVVLKNVTISASLEGENVSFIEQPSIDIDWDYSLMEGYEVVAPHTVYSQFLNGSEVRVPNSKPFALKFDYNAPYSAKDLVIGDLEVTQDQIYLTINYEASQLIKYKLPDYYLGSEHEILLGYSGDDLYLFIDSDFVSKKSIGNISINEIFTNGTIYSNYLNPIEETIDSDGCLYFDGKTRLVFENTSDQFEVGPFAIYLEWTPESDVDYQQLIGHYNWEVWQNKDSIQFQIGRMYEDGPAYRISYPVNSHFFNDSHSLLAIYYPSQTSGHIELFLDNMFSGRVEFNNQTIWDDYGNVDLSLGWTPHLLHNSPFYRGTICSAFYSNVTLNSVLTSSIRINQVDISDDILIPVYGKGTMSELIIII